MRHRLGVRPQRYWSPACLARCRRFAEEDREKAVLLRYPRTTTTGMLLWVSTLTAEHTRRDAAAAMRRHHNCVTSFLSRRIDNRLVGVLVFNLHHIAGHAGRGGSIPRRLEISRSKSGNTLFVLSRRVRDHTRL